MVVSLKRRAPPPLPDAYAWLQECASGGIDMIEASEVLKAFDYWRGDQKLSGELMMALLATIARRLRRHISRRFPNEGKDMIHAATLVITEGLLDPRSKKYKWIRKNFHHFVRFRALDQLAKYEYKTPKGTQGLEIAVPSFCEYTDDTLTAVAEPHANDADDIVALKLFLAKADTVTKAAVKMHFLDGDSLDDTATALGMTRDAVTKKLQPMLDIRNERGGKGARA